MTPPIDFLQFSAACRLVDHDITFEWGTKYLYLVPAEVTRDKWESYVEVCKAYKVPYRGAASMYRFFVTIEYALSLPSRSSNGYIVNSIFDNMPWSVNTPGGGVGGKPAPGARPRMSHKFRRLQVCVGNIFDYYDLAKRYDQGKTMQVRRLNELANDPFVVQWR